MKKLFALFLSLFLIGINLRAQSSLHGGLRISPSLGWLKMQSDDPERETVANNGINFGFAYGAFADYFFKDNFGLSLGLQHRLGSFSYTDNYVTHLAIPTALTSFTRTLHLQYVELPLTLKGRTNEVGYIKYFGEFGLMPAVRVSSRYDVDSVLASGQHIVHNDFPTKVNGSQRINFASVYMVIGLGAEYNLGGTTSLVGSLTFNNGFINVWEPDSKFETYTDKPAYIALNLGVVF